MARKKRQKQNPISDDMEARINSASTSELPRFSELRTECDVVALNVTGKTLLEQHMKAKATQLAEMLAKVDA